MKPVFRSHCRRRASFASDPDRLQRFAQEARAAVALELSQHFLDFRLGDDHGTSWVISAWLEGETLRARFKNR